MSVNYATEATKYVDNKLLVNSQEWLSNNCEYLNWSIVNLRVSTTNHEDNWRISKQSKVALGSPDWRREYREVTLRQKFDKKYLFV